jgi:hypothetical protein
LHPLPEQRHQQREHNNRDHVQRALHACDFAQRLRAAYTKGVQSAARHTHNTRRMQANLRPRNVLPGRAIEEGNVLGPCANGGAAQVRLDARLPVGIARSVEVERGGNQDCELHEQ